MGRRVLLLALLAVAGTADVARGAEDGPYVVGKVVDPDGAPIAGAEIRAYARSSFPPLWYWDPPGWVTSPPRPAARATSDASGAFRLPVPWTGLYVLTADAAGKARRILDGAPADRGDPPVVRLRMTAGHRWTGIVRDHRRKPLAGARVHAFLGQEVDGDLRALARHDAVADEEGAWVVEDAPAPTPRERPTDALCFGPAGEAGTLLSSRRGDIADPVFRKTFLDRSASLRLSLVPSRAGSLPPSLPALVRVEPVESASMATRTTPEGDLRLTGLPAGKWGVTVFVGDAERLHWGRAEVVLRPDMEEHVSLAVREVTPTEIRGTVRTQDRRGIPKASVSVAPTWPGSLMGDFAGATAAEAVTDGSGAFRLRALLLDEPRLLIRADRFILTEPDEYVREGWIRASTTVAADMVPVARLSGRVLDSEGQPVVAARVFAARVLYLSHWTWTGEDGRFLFPAEPPGPCALRAVGPDGATLAEVTLDVAPAARMADLVLRLEE